METSDGLNPLIFAQKFSGDIQVVKLLLKHGADPYAITSSGNQSAVTVARERKDDQLIALFEECKGNHRDFHFYDWPLLSILASHDDFPKAKALLDSSNEPLLIANAPDNYGRTPLMLAIANNNLQFVKYLIEKGADPRISDKEGVTSFHLACEKGVDERIFSLLLSMGGKGDLNRRAFDGKTPLHFISDLRKLKSIAPMIADFNVPDLRGNTPLANAIKNRCDHEFLAELIRLGGNPHDKSALFEAAMRKDAQIYEMLGIKKVVEKKQD